MIYFVIAYIYLLYYLTSIKNIDKIKNIKTIKNETIKNETIKNETIKNNHVNNNHVNNNISVYYHDIGSNEKKYKNISPDNLEIYVSAMIDNNVLEI
jgi:hypothetical protein